VDGPLKFVVSLLLDHNNCDREMRTLVEKVIKNIGFRNGISDVELCYYDVDVLSDWFHMKKSLHPQQMARKVILRWLDDLFSTQITTSNGLGTNVVIGGDDNGTVSEKVVMKSDIDRVKLRKNAYSNPNFRQASETDVTDNTEDNDVRCHQRMCLNLIELFHGQIDIGDEDYTDAELVKQQISQPILATLNRKPSCEEDMMSPSSNSSWSQYYENQISPTVNGNDFSHHHTHTSPHQAKASKQYQGFRNSVLKFLPFCLGKRRDTISVMSVGILM
jgi:hypothetical protein